MSEKNQVEICGQAINQVILMNLASTKPAAKELLEWMVANAAKATHPMGTRRYGVFVLKVVCNQLQNVFIDSPRNDWCRECLDTGVVEVYDVEEGTKYIKCQNCTINGVVDERSNAVSVGNA